MSEPENFVSRWARLKRGTGDAPSQETATAQPHADERAEHDLDERDFDPASLPSIESIGVDTDIRAFLQSRVPLDLTRAALRRAWTSDPAIRDFIGIAENQWNFNEPGSIFGFGPTPGRDDVPELLGKVVERVEEMAGAISKLPAPAEPPLGAATVPPALSAGPVQQPIIGEDAANGAVAAGAPGGESTTVGDGSSRKRRRHGSALPE